MSLLTQNEVLELLGVSRMTLYRLRDDGFPRPMKKSSRLLVWDKGEVINWLESRRA